MSRTIDSILNQRQNETGPIIPPDCTPDEIEEINDFVNRYTAAIKQGDRKAFQTVMMEFENLVEADVEVQKSVAGWMFDKAIRDSSCSASSNR